MASGLQKDCRARRQLLPALFAPTQPRRNGSSNSSRPIFAMRTRAGRTPGPPPSLPPGASARGGLALRDLEPVHVAAYIEGLKPGRGRGKAFRNDYEAKLATPQQPPPLTRRAICCSGPLHLRLGVNKYLKISIVVPPIVVTLTSDTGLVRSFIGGTHGCTGSRILETSEDSQEPLQKRVKVEALVALNFRVPFELRRQIKLAALMRGLTMTELLRAAFEQYFSKTQV